MAGLVVREDCGRAGSQGGGLKHFKGIPSPVELMCVLLNKLPY